MGTKYLPQYKYICVLILLSTSLVQYARLHTKWKNVLYERIEIVAPINATRSKKEIPEDTTQTKNKEHLAAASTAHYNATNDIIGSTISDTESTLIINPDESFMWRGAQSRLCSRIKKKRKKWKSPKKLHLYLVTNCGAIDQRNQHGNFMIGLYAMKLAAMAFQADFTFRCKEIQQKHSVIWWLQSKDNAPTVETEEGNYDNSVNNSLFIPALPTPGIACRGMGHVALHYTSEFVRNDFRAMATELSSSMTAKGMMIDEVGIHLRCGDIINGRISPKDNNYGLVKFQAYRKRIPNTVKSIGIITAPFSERKIRPQDHGSGSKCQILVSELVDYLRSHYPSAEIRVRNDPSESIPEVLSRLVLAEYNFCVRSTFCLLPSLASFGTSFVQEGGVAYFVDSASKAYHHIKLMNEPFLLARDIRERGFNATLRWLTES